MNLIYRTKQLLLLAGDLVCLTASFWLSLTLRAWRMPTWLEIERNLVPFAIVFVIWSIVNYINGLYYLDRNRRDLAFYRRIAETAGFSFVFGMAFFYLIPDQRIAPKTILILTVVLGYCIIALWRTVYAAAGGAKTAAVRVVLAGYTSEGQYLLELTERRPEKEFAIVAIIDPKADPPALSETPFFRDLGAINQVVNDYQADLVVIAPHIQKESAAERQLYQVLFSPVEITDFPHFYERLTGRIPPSTFSEGWFLQHLRRTQRPLYDKARAAADYIVGALLIGLLLLLLPVAALAIRLTSPGPVFIKQQRVGYRGRLFTLYKFRSMYALSADGSAEVGEYDFEKWVAKKGDQRVTPVGKFLRKTRLDELPQAWNLLKRDVTLIGPRPERPEIVRELENRMPYYTLRHIVRPGLTGWALIHQNYTDTVDKALEKLQYDLYYIKNRSLLLDAIIALRTVNVLIRLMGQ